MSNHNIRVDAIGLAAEVVELRNEIARLKGQTNWVCKCGGTDCEGQKENAELRKDKERLDWIFWPSRSRKARTRMLKLLGTPGYRGDEGGMLAWRVAIDEARKEAQP